MAVREPDVMSLSLSFMVIFAPIKEVTPKPAKKEKYAILTKPVTPPPKEGADSKNISYFAVLLQQLFKLHHFM